METKQQQELIGIVSQNFSRSYDIVPSTTMLYSWLDELFEFLFPFGEPSKDRLHLQLTINRNKFNDVLLQVFDDEDEARQKTQLFYDSLSSILMDLYKDAQEILENDPASACLCEIIHIYPGFYAIAVYRLANFIHHQLKVKYIPRILTEYAHTKTGVDINPCASIGVPFFIDHGTGIVIGETCKIGKHVKIYQGVTLGALQVCKGLAGTKRHPTIEDYCVIYANATVLGGDTVVGRNSIIGGNVFLTKSVEPDSVVFTKSKYEVKPNKPLQNDL